MKARKEASNSGKTSFSGNGPGGMDPPHLHHQAPPQHLLRAHHGIRHRPRRGNTGPRCSPRITSGVLLRLMLRTPGPSPRTTIPTSGGVSTPPIIPKTSIIWMAVGGPPLSTSGTSGSAPSSGPCPSASGSPGFSWSVGRAYTAYSDVDENGDGYYTDRPTWEGIHFGRNSFRQPTYKTLTCACRKDFDVPEEPGGDPGRVQRLRLVQPLHGRVHLLHDDSEGTRPCAPISAIRTWPASRGSADRGAVRIFKEQLGSWQLVARSS